MRRIKRNFPKSIEIDNDVIELDKKLEPYVNKNKELKLVLNDNDFERLFEGAAKHKLSYTDERRGPCICKHNYVEYAFRTVVLGKLSKFHCLNLKPIKE